MIGYKKIGLLTLIIACVIWLHWFYRDFSIETIKEYAHELTVLVQYHYVPMVIGYISVFIIATVCVIPITIILTIAGGYLFGIIPGLVYSITGAVTGGACIFLLVRYYLGNYIQYHYQKELVHFNRDMKKYGNLYLLIMQLMPITPPLLPYAFPGLTNMSLVHMMFFSAIGLIPGTFVYVWSGYYLHSIDFENNFFYWTMMLVLLFLAFCILLVIVWLKLKNKSK